MLDLPLEMWLVVALVGVVIAGGVVVKIAAGRAERKAIEAESRERAVERARRRAAEGS